MIKVNQIRVWKESANYTRNWHDCDLNDNHFVIVKILDKNDAWVRSLKDGKIEMYPVVYIQLHSKPAK